MIRVHMFIGKKPTIKFVLRTEGKPNKNGEYPIYIQCCAKGKPSRRTTNLWVRKEHWSGDQKNPIKGNRKSAKLNHELAALRLKYEAAFQNLPQNMDVTPRLVEAILDGTYGQEKENTECGTDFVNYVLKVNEDQFNNGKISYSVWVNVQCVMKKFRKYLKSRYGISGINCNKVNSSVIKGYIAWRRDELENCNESINKALTPIFKALKSMVNRQWISPDEYDQMVEYLPCTPKTLNTPSKNSTVHFLTEEQVKQFKEISCTIKNKATLCYVDLFLFAVHTGMRVSDMLTLQWEDVNMDKRMIEKIMIKGHTRKQKNLSIPLLPPALEILKKWQGINKRFVFGCLDENIDLDNEAELHNSIANKNRAIQTSLRTIGQKLDLGFNLTIHVGRHTFATLALNKGVNVHVISNVLGHSSTSTTEKVYAKFLPSTIQAELNEKLNFDF